MKNRPEPSKQPDLQHLNLPKCLCCAFSLLEEAGLRHRQNRFAGLYAGFRLWRPPTNRHLVMHHTDEFADES